jgi:hypothetical protein
MAEQEAAAIDRVETSTRYQHVKSTRSIASKSGRMRFDEREPDVAGFEPATSIHHK